MIYAYTYMHIDKCKKSQSVSQPASQPVSQSVEYMSLMKYNTVLTDNI